MGTTALLSLLLPAHLSVGRLLWPADALTWVCQHVLNSSQHASRDL